MTSEGFPFQEVLKLHYYNFLCKQNTVKITQHRWPEAGEPGDGSYLYPRIYNWTMARPTVNYKIVIRYTSNTFGI